MIKMSMVYAAFDKLGAFARPKGLSRQQVIDAYRWMVKNSPSGVQPQTGLDEIAQASGIPGGYGAVPDPMSTLRKLIGLDKRSSAELSISEGERAYLYGFIQKCAELGVHPEALVKAAGIRSAGRAGIDFAKKVYRGTKGAVKGVADEYKAAPKSDTSVRDFVAGATKDTFDGLRGNIQHAGTKARMAGQGAGAATLLGSSVAVPTALFAGSGEKNDKPKAKAKAKDE